MDFLPYKKPETPRRKRLGVLRFAVSFAFVASLFLFKVQDLEMVMLWSFIAGNLLCYAVGIALAFAFRDNRAFCKYLCPITVFLKPVSYFALFRIKPKPDKCVHCGVYERVCPMNVEVANPARNRKNGTECILCHECVKACPKKAF